MDIYSDPIFFKRISQMPSLALLELLPQKKQNKTHHCRFFWWSCRFDGFYLGYLTASLPDAAWPCPWGTTKAAQPTWWTSWVGAVTKLQMGRGSLVVWTLKLVDCLTL